LYALFKNTPDSVCISYLATGNTINAIIGKLAGIRFRIGGIRSSKIHWFKKIIQRHLHNYWLTYSIFNNKKGFEELISEGFRKEKGLVIFNCIEMPQQIVKSDKTDKINILTVGRFVEAKDFKTAFDAFHLVVRKNNNVKYTVVGHGPLESELKNYILKEGLANYVDFIINPPQVDDYYKTADIYLSTSVFEGLSNSIMEAMSFNLPVVATDVGDNKYLVKNNESGFLLPVKDVEGISTKLETLINNADLRKKMGNNGYEHMRKNFSVEKFTQEYTNLIERLMDEHQ
jgi:glycosyltransferase involved in cell wall biosynthesis